MHTETRTIKCSIRGAEMNKFLHGNVSELADILLTDQTLNATAEVRFRFKIPEPSHMSDGNLKTTNEISKYVAACDAVGHWTPEAQSQYELVKAALNSPYASGASKDAEVLRNIQYGFTTVRRTMQSALNNTVEPFGQRVYTWNGISFTVDRENGWQDDVKAKAPDDFRRLIEPRLDQDRQAYEIIMVVPANAHRAFSDIRGELMDRGYGVHCGGIWIDASSKHPFAKAIYDNSKTTELFAANVPGHAYNRVMEKVGDRVYTEEAPRKTHAA
jgi:hypothetical protein